MQLRRAVLIALLAAACHQAPTERPPDAMPDALMLSDAETSTGCDFVQRNHTSLPDLEFVPFTYTGQPVTFCGSDDWLADPLYPNLCTMESTFPIDVPAPVESIMRFQSDAPITGINYYGHSNAVATTATSGFELTRMGGYGVMDLVSVNAPHTASSGTPIHYKLTLQAFSFDQICPAVSTPAEYTESHDGSASTGNDMAMFENGVLTALPAANAMLEKTGLTIASGSSHRIHGTSGNVTIDGNGMLDKDTYEVTTGPDTVVLSVRATPPKTQGIYYMFLLTSPDLLTYQMSGDTRNGPLYAESLGVFQVQPSTTYWVQIFAVNYTTKVTLPVDYDLSVCGANASL